jgi:hypothetical protein
MKGTFQALNPNAEIFLKLKSDNPPWWNLFKNTPELYIDIRKDNYISVYYQGGSVAEITYDTNFVAKTHQKYLGDSIPRGKTKGGKDKFEYDNIDLSSLDAAKISEIKNYINIIYSQSANSEHPSEKYIQGKMITGKAKYIDSELQFNKELEIDNLRIDLVEMSNCILSFVELKVISDSRLRNDELRNSEIPEIIKQMEKYQIFIKNNCDDILNYYNKLLAIKQNLGLTKIICPNLSLNKIPKLIIANTYKKTTFGRTNRIESIEKLLTTHKIDFEIINWV